jgi:hypothetical protein
VPAAIEALISIMSLMRFKKKELNNFFSNPQNDKTHYVPQKRTYVFPVTSLYVEGLRTYTRETGSFQQVASSAP